MGYDNTIDYLKQALDSYSADEEKLSNLYKGAMENAEKNYDLAMKQLEKQYYDDRNAAYADSARSNRNTGIFLAERGLGFSGEAAQSQLNSNIALSGRLGALEGEKSKNENQLRLDLANQKNQLAMDESEKFRLLSDSKNGLISDIAGMELDYENAQAKLAADEAKLKAEIDMHNQSIQAEKDMHTQSIQADKDMQNSALRAEIDMHNASLKNDMDMLEAELLAKYNNANNSGNSGNKGQNSASGGNNGSNNIGNSGNADTSTENKTAYIPDISSKDLASRLIGSATDDGRINSIHDRYNIHRYLLDLYENYDIDETYFNDLIFMIKAYGYEETSIASMRRQVISYEAYDFYQKTYDDVYDREIANGSDEYTAVSRAKSAATLSKLDYAYEHCAHLTEFRICCEEMGYSKSTIESYITNHQAGNSSSNSANGSGGQYYGSMTESTQ